MNQSRRTMLASLAAASGSALFAPFATPRQAEAAPAAAGPKRVVFFLQNHGFSPEHARPVGVKINEKTLDKIEDAPLAGLDLPTFIDPLTPYKDRLTIVQGLNGKHVSPYHGAPYGALGGYKKSPSTPQAETIDCALGRALPAVVPLLALGWEALPRMQGSPIGYASSAWGPSKAAPMFADPLLAHNSLFGVARPGEAREQFEADTELFEFAQHDVERMHARLAGSERKKFDPFLEGFHEAAERRRKLLAMAPQLEKHAPLITEQFTKPRFETDWWEAGLAVAIQSLIAGVTNVVTVSSGMCSAGSTWYGLGLKNQGHTLGHTNQSVEPDWLKLRRYNMELLLRIVKALEAVPEGGGTMFDHTLIVYSSCHGEAQHSTGNRWPFLLLGNLGGAIKSGRYLHYPLEPRGPSRTINALYNTLLQAVGAPRDRFNLTGSLKELDRPGPLPEILA